MSELHEAESPERQAARAKLERMMAAADPEQRKARFDQAAGQAAVEAGGAVIVAEPDQSPGFGGHEANWVQPTDVNYEAARQVREFEERFSQPAED